MKFCLIYCSLTTSTTIASCNDIVPPLNFNSFVIFLEHLSMSIFFINWWAPHYFSLFMCSQIPFYGYERSYPGNGKSKRIDNKIFTHISSLVLCRYVSLLSVVWLHVWLCQTEPKWKAAGRKRSYVLLFSIVHFNIYGFLLNVAMYHNVIKSSEVIF